MEGRKLFKFFYPFFLFLSFFLYVLPKFIVEWLWLLSDFFPDKISAAVKYIIALRLMKKIGKNVYFGKNVTIKYWHNIIIGENVSIHNNCYLDGLGNLKIGNNVSIAHNTSLITFEHSWEDKNIPIKYNKLVLKPIFIKDDVWIGCGVRILAGVKINRRVIVGAGSVVTKDIPSNKLVAGVPARILKEI